MAGSWGHVTNDDGTLRKDFSTLDTGGDVTEAIWQMYGMIWFLARALEAAYRTHPTREGVLAQIRQARDNHRQGRAWGEEMR